MSQIHQINQTEENELFESPSSLRPLFVAVATGLVFWASLFALFFFVLQVDRTSFLPCLLPR